MLEATGEVEFWCQKPLAGCHRCAQRRLPLEAAGSHCCCHRIYAGSHGRTSTVAGTICSVATWMGGAARLYAVKDHDLLWGVCCVVR